MDDLISVVIPVYNVEKYLNRCIDSVLKQTYKNIEIILIDDGSTDRSGKICDEYNKKDNRIIVIHQKNQGLSSARNNGLMKLKGKFVCFIDSDDFVETDYIESMYNNLIDNKVDMACCGYAYFYENGKIEEINYGNIEKKYSKDEAQEYLNIIGYFNVATWNKLYKIELFDNIKFPINKKSEDWFIMYKLIDKCANGIYYSSKVKYLYFQRNGSITKSNNVNFDCIDAARQALEYYKEKNMQNVIPFAYQSLLFAYIGVYNSLYFRVKNKEKAKKIRRQALSEINNIKIDKLSKSRIIQYKLFRNNIILYNFLFFIFNEKRKQKMK